MNNSVGSGQRFSGPFAIKVILGIAIAAVCFIYIEQTVSATTERFGGLGWIHWIIGFLLTAAGVIASWATAITLIDLRAIRRYRVRERQAIENGQTVALSGRIRVEGEPLVAPFSKTPSACFSYQVSGQRRVNSSGSSQTRAQLCLLGFHLAPAFLESDERSLRLAAIADVDTDFRHVDSGKRWGEQAQSMIQAGADTWPRSDEPEARDALSAAQGSAPGATAEDFFVSSTESASNTISVVEDAVPVNTEVTVLARFDALAEALDGQRLGGMKIFPGGIDERLAGLAYEARKGTLWGLPMLAIGLGLMTLAMWWPNGTGG